jgi:Glycosyl hydrolase catalytic core
MPRQLTLLAAALTAALTLALSLLPAAADARVGIRVGIGDQQVGIFDQPAFQRAKFKRVRYFIPWNAMDNAGQRLAARAYVKRARSDGFQVFLHVSSDDLRIKKAKLPSVSQYKSKVRRLVRYFRALGVREFGTWNEANHASQPTYRSPRRAAQFFREMYRAVKGRCRSCVVVALDVLDQRGVERYMRSWYRALSSTYRRRATVVGIHNYGDVNRKRTTYTRNIIRQSRRYNRRTQFWFTETGGIVKFGRSFPCSTNRARNRLSNMFSLANTYRRSGVKRVYVYNWTGAGCDARFDAGLTNPDGSVRPGYTYLRQKLRNYLR